MVVDLTITERCRKYGYVIWPISLDGKVRQLLGHSERMTVILDGKTLGEKNIDWKHRRISIGPKQTRRLSPDDTLFRLQRSPSGTLDISIRK